MAVQCGICLDHCSLDSERFSIFPCGHGFCTECISRLFSEPQPKCPNCRAPLHEGDAHPVYIDFVDTQMFLRDNLSDVDGSPQIGADTPINIEEVCHELGRISEGSNVDISLLVEDFKERVLSVFTKIDSQKEEIDNLWVLIRQLQRENIEILQYNSKEMEPWRAEVVRSKMAVGIQKEENDGLRDSLRKLRRDNEALQIKLGPLQAEVGRWKRAVEIQKDDNDILQVEMRRLRRAKELLQAKVKKIGPLQDELGRLKTALLETERKVVGEQKASHRVNLNMTRWKEKVTELEKENARHTFKAHLQEENNKELKRQIAILKKKLPRKEKESTFSDDDST